MSALLKFSSDSEAERVHTIYLYDITKLHGFFSVTYKQFLTLKNSQCKHQISQMIPSVTKFRILSTLFLKLISNSPAPPVVLVPMEKDDIQSIFRLVLWFHNGHHSMLEIKQSVLFPN